jgi:hypothetical protein
MDRYYRKHIYPFLKKYKIDVRDIVKAAENAIKNKTPIAREFYPPPKDDKQEWEIARGKYYTAYYILFGAKMFDEKKRVIRDWIGMR